MNLKKEVTIGGGKFVLALGAVLVALESMAATRTVSTEAELVAAVAAAASKDTILLKSGTYDLSLVEPQNPKDSNGIASIFVDNKTLYFVGEDATSWREKADNTTGVILKGTNTARIVYGYAGSGRGSTFRHITFDGGVAPSGKNGGAIYFMDCRFNGWASNCVFRNCRAYDGGATAYVTLRDCLFENNEASHMGGAAFCGISTYQNVSSVNEIRNCEFRGNRASYGGAVRWFGQGVTAGCTFRTNCATTAGGAMHANNAPNGTLVFSYSLMTNCLFEGNFGSSSSVGSDYGGGAVWQPGPTVNCTFIGNSYSNNYGGALYKAQGGVTGCVFRANVAYWGGAVSHADKPLAGCTFEGNEAMSDGGAVYKASDVVTGCVFTANAATNTATSKGGALWGGTVIGCWFTNNVCLHGGAVAGNIGSAPAAVAIDCEFVGNHASNHGGAAYKLWAATNCLFAYNQSTNQGGACHLGYQISGCVVTGNRSLKNRGGAFSESEVFDSVISNNYSPLTHGGAGTKTTFTGCAFSGVGAVSGGWCRDCTFTGLRPANSMEAQFGVFDCLHNGGGDFGATNCLITGCSGFECLVNNEGSTSTVVNCTFAGNTLLSDKWLARVASGPHYKSVGGVISEEYRVPAHSEFVNCLFAGNVRAGGAAVDLTFLVRDDDTSIGTTTCHLSNCLHESAANPVTQGGAEIELVDVFQGNPHFAGVQLAPEHPYTLKYASAARGRGLNMAWMTGAKDLAGVDRILDGTADIGCYECNLPPVGTLMLFR